MSICSYTKHLLVPGNPVPQMLPPELSAGSSPRVRHPVRRHILPRDPYLLMKILQRVCRLLKLRLVTPRLTHRCFQTVTTTLSLLKVSTYYIDIQSMYPRTPSTNTSPVTLGNFLCTLEEPLAVISGVSSTVYLSSSFPVIFSQLISCPLRDPDNQPAVGRGASRRLLWTNHTLKLPSSKSCHFG